MAESNQNLICVNLGSCFYLEKLVLSWKYAILHIAKKAYVPSEQGIFQFHAFHLRGRGIWSEMHSPPQVKWLFVVLSPSNI